MISSDLLAKINQYIESNLTLEELEDWLAPQLPAFLKNTKTTDAEIVGLVELGLAEMSDHILTEEDFKASLREELRKINSVWAAYPPDAQARVESESASTIVNALAPMPQTRVPFRVT